MDTPPIQYAKTADDVSIAFWAIGEGPPLVILPNVVASHVQLEWEFQPRRIAYERLAERATVIRYDCRGIGLSPHDNFDISADAGALDLNAVATRLGLDRLAIIGSTITADVTCTYPAANPDRISHLIITVPSLRRSYMRRFTALLPLAEMDWEYFTEIWARLNFAWEDPVAYDLAAWFRASHTPSSLRSIVETMASFPPLSVLGAIRAPTLILHGPSTGASTTQMIRTLAGGIVGAHMLAIPGWPSGLSFSETAVKATLDFINTKYTAPGGPIPPPQIDISAVRTIVFTDVEGSTALNERLGDEGARKVMREHERLTREALGAHGGSEVKAMGDGFMAWFPSATRAVECAIALQRAFADRNTTVGAQRGARPNDVSLSEEAAQSASPTVKENAAPLRPATGSLSATGSPLRPAEPLRIRIGINAGEPIAEGDDLFGASVIATARIAAAAQGGQILASDVVRQLLAGKSFNFADQGEHALKGFDEPARLYEVRWRESA